MLRERGYHLLVRYSISVRSICPLHCVGRQYKHCCKSNNSWTLAMTHMGAGAQPVQEAQTTADRTARVRSRNTTEAKTGELKWREHRRCQLTALLVRTTSSPHSTPTPTSSSWYSQKTHSTACFRTFRAWTVCRRGWQVCHYGHGVSDVTHHTAEAHHARGCLSSLS